jgi:hypothetical protein
MMRSTSSSRYPSPPSPVSRLPSTTPTSPEESTDGIETEEGLPRLLLHSAAPKAEVEECDVLCASDLISSFHQVDEAPERWWAGKLRQNYSILTTSHSSSLPKISVPALPDAYKSTPPLTISASTAGRVASVASLTPSEQALLGQNFWGFSGQYLKKLVELLTSLPNVGVQPRCWEAGKCSR